MLYRYFNLNLCERFCRNSRLELEGYNLDELNGMTLFPTPNRFSIWNWKHFGSRFHWWEPDLDALKKSLGFSYDERKQQHGNTEYFCLQLVAIYIETSNATLYARSRNKIMNFLSCPSEFRRSSIWSKNKRVFLQKSNYFSNSLKFGQYHSLSSTCIEWQLNLNFCKLKSTVLVPHLLYYVSSLRILEPEWFNFKVLYRFGFHNTVHQQWSMVRNQDLQSL